MQAVFQEPTEQRYHLKCKIQVKEVTYDDCQSKGTTQNTEQMVYLIPKESTQLDLFLSAWLPDDEMESYEVGLLIGHPVNGPCRASVHRQDGNLSQPYLFVMSRGAEEDLKQMAGRDIEIIVLGEFEETTLDQAKDYDLALNKNI